MEAINYVEKYFDMQMSSLEAPIIKQMPLFMNGISVKQSDSNMEILVYQELFSDIVVFVVYDENKKEIRKDRLVYRAEKNNWWVLPDVKR